MDFPSQMGSDSGQMVFPAGFTRAVEAYGDSIILLRAPIEIVELLAIYQPIRFRCDLRNFVKYSQLYKASPLSQFRINALIIRIHEAAL